MSGCQATDNSKLSSSGYAVFNFSEKIVKLKFFFFLLFGRGAPFRLIVEQFGMSPVIVNFSVRRFGQKER